MSKYNSLWKYVQKYETNSFKLTLCMKEQTVLFNKLE